MPIESGSCVLVIDGQRFEGISFAVERNSEPQDMGFLSGPVEVLRMARKARKIALEFANGTTLPATMLEVNRSGMALVAFDPRLPQSNESRN
jgi:hypothetical protein